MTRGDLVRLSEARSRAAEHLRNLGMMNAYGRSHEDQVKGDAAYRIALDIHDKAEKEYRDAIANLTAEELKAIWEAKP